MESAVEREQMEEFYAVREAAFDALRFGTLVERHRSVPVCQYLILPSFENPISWDVIKVVSRGEGAQTRLYRSTWRLGVDSQAMSSPVERMKHPRPYKPTLETSWVLMGPVLRAVGERRASGAPRIACGAGYRSAVILIMAPAVSCRNFFSSEHLSLLKSAL